MWESEKLRGVWEEWLLEKIYNIVKKADDREFHGLSGSQRLSDLTIPALRYREAAEAYLDLTIGKVGELGLTEVHLASYIVALWNLNWTNMNKDSVGCWSLSEFCLPLMVLPWQIPRLLGLWALAVVVLCSWRPVAMWLSIRKELIYFSELSKNYKNLNKWELVCKLITSFVGFRMPSVSMIASIATIKLRTWDVWDVWDVILDSSMDHGSDMNFKNYILNLKLRYQLFQDISFNLCKKIMVESLHTEWNTPIERNNWCCCQVVMS